MRNRTERLTCSSSSPFDESVQTAPITNDVTDPLLTC
jgi:hypothetical protein